MSPPGRAPRPASVIALDFLKTELAPSPARWRATARTTIACTLAALLIVSLQIPDGHWIIMTILVLHQPNAGASVRKGFERVLGTIVGSTGAILAIAAFAQQPWFAFPLIGLFCSIGLFLSRTSVVPYAALLGAVTTALFMSVGVLEPHEVVRQGLWRMLLISLGVVIGTGAHLLLWPIDPERVLLDSLAKALSAVAAALRRRLQSSASEPAADRALVNAWLSDLPTQLALLQAAEARHPSLRRRHVEQLALLGSVSRLVTAAAASVEEASPEAIEDEGVRSRMERIAALCTTHAELIRFRDEGVAAALDLATASSSLDQAAPRPTPSPAPPTLGREGPPRPTVSAEIARVIAHLVEMEAALGPIPAALAFVRDPRGRLESSSSASPLDEPDAPQFLTPALSLSNSTDLAYALKGGLAAMVAQAAAMGLGMSNPAAATVTAVIVAQGTVGATLLRAVLRAAGAVIGGALAIATMVLVFPNTDSVAPFLAVVAGCFGVAAYVVSGSPRTAYTGIQIGMAYAMSILDSFGPTTDLSVPRDRVLGILLGIAIFTVIDFSIAPAFAGRESARGIASALERMAALSRRALGESGAALRAAHRAAIRPLSAIRRQTVEDLTAALQREDEALLEPGAWTHAASAARRARLALLHQAQATLLVVLAIVRDRLNFDLETIPVERRHITYELAAAIGPNLEAIADRIEGRPPRPAPALEPLLVALEREAIPSGDPFLLPLIAQRAFYREITPMIAELERGAEAYRDALASPREA